MLTNTHSSQSQEYQATLNKFNSTLGDFKVSDLYKAMKDAQTSIRNSTEVNEAQLDRRLRALKQAFGTFSGKHSDLGMEWEKLAGFSDEEFISNHKSRPEMIGGMFRRMLIHFYGGCAVPGCPLGIKLSDFDHHSLYYGIHIDHTGKKKYEFKNLLHDIDKYIQEVEKGIGVATCAGCHDQHVPEDYCILASKLRNTLRYPKASAHVRGRKLVLNFDVVVALAKCVCLGFFGNIGITKERGTLQDMEVIFYQHFGRLFEDSTTRPKQNLEQLYPLQEAGRRRDRLNSGQTKQNHTTLAAFVDILKRQSGRCAYRQCAFVDVQNISPFHATFLHWDHEEENNFPISESSSIYAIMNEIGRYCALTCSCHHGAKSWFNEMGYPGRIFNEEEARQVQRLPKSQKRKRRERGDDGLGANWELSGSDSD